MQRDIAVNLVPTPRPAEAVLAGLNVSFQSADPKLAMRDHRASRRSCSSRRTCVTVRRRPWARASFSTRSWPTSATGSSSSKPRSKPLRAQSRGGQVTQTDLLPYEVLRERYRALLVRREEARSAEPTRSGVELGEQFKKVAEAARLPRAAARSEPLAWGQPHRRARGSRGRPRARRPCAADRRIAAG